MVDFLKGSVVYMGIIMNKQEHSQDYETRLHKTFSRSGVAWRRG
jgi:hypothetical protein